MNKLVLVTGAEGFIGSHLVELLLEKGYKVRAFSWYHPSGNRGWLPPDHPQLEHIQGDIRDLGTVEKAMEGVDIVYHLAALITIPYSYQAPDSYIATNVGGTLNVLQAARKTDISHLLITSSSEVYGTAQYVPIDEQHPLQAQSPYSASKIAKEKLAESFFFSYDLPVTLMRPFNTYGPRQSLRGLLPSLILQLLSGKEEILIGDLRPTRDWVFVKDTARAMISLAMKAESLGKAINIATGQECSVGELAQTCIDLINPQAVLKPDPKRNRPQRSEVFRLCGSAQLLRTLTNWEAEYSLKAGVKESIAWYRVHKDEQTFQNLSYRI